MAKAKLYHALNYLVVRVSADRAQNRRELRGGRIPAGEYVLLRDGMRKPHDAYGLVKKLGDKQEKAEAALPKIKKHQILAYVVRGLKPAQWCIIEELESEIKKRLITQDLC